MESSSYGSKPEHQGVICVAFLVKLLFLIKLNMLHPHVLLLMLAICVNGNISRHILLPNLFLP